MKISELIVHLQQIQKEHGDLTVCISGYEGGITESISPGTALAAVNVNKEAWYYGEHEILDEYNKEELAVHKNKLFCSLKASIAVETYRNIP